MDISAREYFLSKLSDSSPERHLYNRIVGAIRMHEGTNAVITMKDLCKMPEKELENIRRLGKVTRAIVMKECRNYLSEQDETEPEDST